MAAICPGSRSQSHTSRKNGSNRESTPVGGAIGKLPLAELRARLEAHEVGFSPIYDASDIFSDPQFAAREAIVRVPDSELGEVRMQCVVPRFSETPGGVRRAGPALGEHNEEVFGALGISAGELARLKAAKVI